MASDFIPSGFMESGFMESDFMASDFMASGAMADWASAGPPARPSPRATTASSLKVWVMRFGLSLD